jgi:hypothetical protein
LSKDNSRFNSKASGDSVDMAIPKNKLATVLLQFHDDSMTALKVASFSPADCSILYKALTYFHVPRGARIG